MCLSSENIGAEPLDEVFEFDFFFVCLLEDLVLLSLLRMNVVNFQCKSHAALREPNCSHVSPRFIPFALPAHLMHHRVDFLVVFLFTLLQC